MNKKFQSSIKALILDMDGVLWRGSESIGDLQAIFKQILCLGWKVFFATNNATRSPQQYVDLLSSLGVFVEESQVVTSAVAVIYYLNKKYPTGAPVYIIGENGLIESCASQGFYQDEINPVAVIAGMDRFLTYEKLKIATLLIRKGIPFIGTNPDLTFPTPQGLVPGAGSILAAITAASGVVPYIVGKPEPTIYQIALERLRLSVTQVLVVGDRPETDIAGAQRIGCYTALVLSGVTNKDQANAWKPAPDIIAPDLESIVNMNWLKK